MIRSIGPVGFSDGNNRYVPERLRQPSAAPISFIAAGNNHCLALSITGSVWAWGHNTHGQVGVEGIGEVFEPVRLRGLPGKKIKELLNIYCIFA